MRRHEVKGEELKIFTMLPDGNERPLFRHGQRRDEMNGTVMPYAINYVYHKRGGYTEYESIEFYRDQTHLAVKDFGPWKFKYLVREHPNLAVRLPLRVDPLDWPRDTMVNATLVDLGHTEVGGEGDNPFEPWAHFQIDDPGSLEHAFGHLRGEGRQPNDTGSYLEIKIPYDAPRMSSLISGFRLAVNGREVTFRRCLALTIDYGPDTAGGQVGPMLKATLRKITWVEGNPDHLGML